MFPLLVVFPVGLYSPSPMKYTSRYSSNLINKPINHSNTQCHKIMDTITYPVRPFPNLVFALLIFYYHL